MSDGIAAGRTALVDELKAYSTYNAGEARMRDRIVAFVAAEPRAFARELEIGHLTASAWIVDPAGTRALLTHHRKANRWFQPGGHADGDPDLRRAALREAREETGLTTLRFASAAIYDVDVHPIPARKGEPAHEHFDVRFAFFADPDEPFVVSDESHALAWVALGALREYGADASVLRLARKTAALLRPPSREG